MGNLIFNGTLHMRQAKALGMKNAFSLDPRII